MWDLFRFSFLRYLVPLFGTLFFLLFFFPPSNFLSVFLLALGEGERNSALAFFSLITVVLFQKFEAAKSEVVEESLCFC